MKIQLISLAWIEIHIGELAPDELRALAARFTYGGAPDPHEVQQGAHLVSRYMDRRAFPTEFVAEASGGEVFRCVDHGCHCGWSYVYAPGEPKALPL